MFFDFDSIKAGADWRDAIDQALDECVVVLVVIGDIWPTLARLGSPIPRIQEPGDMVRHEIQRAFRKRKIVIPILIDNAPMPNTSQLPHGLKKLPRKNGMLLDTDNFFAKMDVLVDRIIELLGMSLKSGTP